MKIQHIPPIRNKTLWCLFNAPNVYTKLKVVNFIMRRYLNMIGFDLIVNDEFMVKVDNFLIHFSLYGGELEAFNGIFFKRLYEPYPEFYPENNKIIIDCGANIGIYTLKAAIPKTNKVFSIEPNPMVFGRLKKNIKTNNLVNVIPINKGIGCCRNRTRLYWKKVTVSGSIKPEAKSKGKEWDKSVDVEIITLDDIIEQYHLQTVDLIKIDIEGSEYDALVGAKKTLNITKKLILEFHSDELRDKCESLLQVRGFRKIHEIPEHQFYINL